MVLPRASQERVQTPHMLWHVRNHAGRIFVTSEGVNKDTAGSIPALPPTIRPVTHGAHSPHCLSIGSISGLLRLPRASGDGARDGRRCRRDRSSHSAVVDGGAALAPVGRQDVGPRRLATIPSAGIAAARTWARSEARTPGRPTLELGTHALGARTGGIRTRGPMPEFAEPRFGFPEHRRRASQQRQAPVAPGSSPRMRLTVRARERRKHHQIHRLCKNLDILHHALLGVNDKMVPMSARGKGAGPGPGSGPPLQSCAGRSFRMPSGSSSDSAHRSRSGA